MSESRRTSASEAEIRHSRWPGWIWAVPIAALGIAGWLLARALAQRGTHITIMFSDAQRIDPHDTSIMYRGMEVGRITDVSLSKDGGGVIVSAKIADDAAQFLRTRTVFWLRGAHPSMYDMSSLGALFSGPNIEMEPGEGESTKQFTGLAREPLPGKREEPVLFSVSFAGVVGDIRRGEFVNLLGFPVGEVKEVGFHYDAKTGSIETPITLALYPDLFPIVGATRPESAETLAGVIRELVEKGLRARLERDPPLIGGHRVTLAIVPNAPAAKVEDGCGTPEIPSAPDDGLDSLAARLNAIPIDEIAHNVLDVTQRVDALVSSPMLKDSIDQLNGSLRDIRELVAHARPEVDTLLKDMRATAGHLDQLAKSADKTLGGAASQTGLRDTLREIKEAAAAVRSLAAYLDRHPEALISGR